MVVKYGHDALPTYGIGKDRSPGFWRGVIRQLIARGALQTGSGEYASLSLVDEHARPILRRETTVMLRQEADPAPVARTSVRRERVPAGMSEAPGDDPLFDALRAWRATAAKTQAVPPYVIFHDSVLREIAAARPADMDDLAGIKGVGGSKLSRYGVAVLGIVRQHG